MSAMARSRAQTRGEELANSLSHGIGLALAVAALPILVHGATQRGRVRPGTWHRMRRA